MCMDCRSHCAGFVKALACHSSSSLEKVFEVADTCHEESEDRSILQMLGMKY